MVYDLISRQAAIDAASYECGELRGVFGRIEERLKALPSAQPERRFDEWCTDCKEYDQEKHCCPRFNHVIRTTLQEVQAEQPRIVRCKDCKWWDFAPDNTMLPDWHRCRYYGARMHTRVEDFCSRGERRE